MKQKLYLSAGHSSTVYDSITKKKKTIQPDRGAISNINDVEYVEGDLTAELRMLIVNAFLKENIQVITDSDNSVLKQTISFFKPLIASYNDIAIDLHFNSSNNINATGVEILVPSNPSAFELVVGSELSKIISKYLDIPNRGVKTEIVSPRKKLGWMRLACENFIIEVCFISNKRDMQQYNDNKEKLANAIVQSLKLYLK